MARPLKSLKVLFFVTRDWYHPATTGGDNTLWEYARYLASVGHAVTFLTASFPGAAKEERLDGINVVRLGGGIHWLWLQTFLYYMSKCRGKYDVVVAEGFGGSRIPRLAPVYVKEPVITAWHQIHRDLFAVQYPKALGGPLNLLERMAAWVHRNTLVQAYTPEWQQAFPRIGFKPENVFVVPVSIREEWFSPQDVHRPAEPTILWLGKIRRYKCPDHAIQAMAVVVKDIARARLVIAGRHDDLEYEAELRNLINRLHLQNHVEFHFDVTESDKRELLRGSSLLVLPSAVEGFGIVVLEANACGVPVIASSGVPESVVRHGNNGLRYPFGHIEAMSQEILKALADEELYARLSANSLAFATQFSWGAVGAAYEKVVVRALSGQKPQVRNGQSSD